MSRVRSGLATRGEGGAGGSRARRAPTPRDLVQLCAFSIGEELYAIDIMRIKEIINPLPITRVPKAPSFVEGVIELRGTILPVIDLRKRFDLPSLPLTRGTKFLIVAIDPTGPSGPSGPGGSAGPGGSSAPVGGAAGSPGGSTGDRWILGVVVDRVLEVIRIARDDIRATPAVAIDEDARFFAGVCQHRERIVMLVDIDAVLSSTERLSLAGMGQAAALPSPSLRPELDNPLGASRELVRRGRHGGQGGHGGSGGQGGSSGGWGGSSGPARDG